MTREEAIRILEKMQMGEIREIEDYCLDAIDMAIKALQEPKRKHSKWINMGTHSVCATCQHIKPVPHFPPYCEMCGALMDGRQEGELE